MRIHSQLFRYALVGLSSSLILYSLYLLITWLGVGHKTTMTLLYCLGTSLTFAFNKKWTFSHEGHISSTFIGYVSIYAMGYMLNFGALYLLVDKLGYSHELIQGVMVLLVALLLFLLQKKLVFNKNT